MNFGVQVRSARRKLRLTQSQLATKAGIGVATVQNIEAGRANPELNTVIELLKALKLKIILQPIRQREVSLNDLAALGCPILSKGDGNLRFKPNRIELQWALESLSPNEIRGRAREAVASWMIAIKDHYPSIWRDVPVSIRAWSTNQKVKPKLRRLALVRLGEYL